MCLYICVLEMALSKIKTLLFVEIIVHLNLSLGYWSPDQEMISGNGGSGLPWCLRW